MILLLNIKSSSITHIQTYQNLYSCVEVECTSTPRLPRTNPTRPDFHSTITRLRFQLLVLVLGQSSFLRPLVVLSIIVESSGRFAFCLDCMERSRRLVLLRYRAPSRSVPAIHCMSLNSPCLKLVRIAFGDLTV